MVTALTATATCQRCDWSQTADPAAVDRAADAHVRKLGHPTVVRTTKATR